MSKQISTNIKQPKDLKDFNINTGDNESYMDLDSPKNMKENEDNDERNNRSE